MLNKVIVVQEPPWAEGTMIGIVEADNIIINDPRRVT
jgi:hypothetical protein